MDPDEMAGEAELWAIRLDGNAVSGAAQEELQRWLATDERNAGALLRAQAALSWVDQALASDEEELGGTGRWMHSLVGRRKFILGVGVGASASALAAAGLAGLLFRSTPPVEVETALGEVRRTPLPDGSIAALNTSTRILVAMQDDRRAVTLHEGEAWFEVVQDRARPFVVQAGPIRVRAVGTAFSVRRRDAGAEVLVSHGSVSTWVEGREHEVLRLRAGSRVFVPDAGVPLARSGIVGNASGEIERTLAWRSGDLILEGESLAFAASELNRHNSRKIVIKDPELAREPLVGYFKTNEPERFARTAADLVGGRAIVESNQIRIEPRR